MIHADDTVSPLVDECAHRSVQGRVWAYVNGQTAYFELTDAREGRYTQRFLVAYRDYIQADAFPGSSRPL